MKKLTKVLLLVVALCMMIAVMGIAAAATGDSVAKIGETEYATLADAITAAQSGDTIELLCDIELSGSDCISINKVGTYTIDGKGFKITPANETFAYHRFLFGESGQDYDPDRNYTLKNVTISGFTNSAYFIRAEGCALTLENCVIKNNNHPYLSGGDDPQGSRIVLATSADLTIDGCEISGNTTTLQTVDFNTNGAANATAGTFTVKDCLFTNNTVTHGSGIIYSYGSTSNNNIIKDSTFSGNTIESAAASVIYFSGKTSVTGCLFKDNNVTATNSTQKCGVLALGSGATGSVYTGNAFVNNTLTTTGHYGKIYAGSTNVDLSCNYWGGSATVAGTTDGSDIYLGKTSGVVYSNYAIAYEVNENGCGVTVTLYVPPVAEAYDAEGGTLIGQFPTVNEAIAAAGATYVKLLDNVTLTAPLTMTKSYTLDFNGKTIYYNTTATTVINGSSNIIFKNGTLDISGAQMPATAAGNDIFSFNPDGNTLTFDNMALYGDGYGGYSVFWFKGNNTTPVNTLNFVNGSSIVLKDEAYGSGGVFKGPGAYHENQFFVVNITDSTVSCTNVYRFSLYGTINVKDSTVTFTGGENAFRQGIFTFDHATVTVSGANADEGKGIVPRFGNTIVMNGSALTFIGSHIGKDILFEYANNIVIYDTSTVTAASVSGTADDRAIVAPANYVLVTTDNGGASVTYSVAPAVAQIGETKYASLYDAAAAVQDGDTITMIANTLETNEVKFDFDGSATLDLNGYTVATNEDIWIRTGRLTVVGGEGSKVTSLGNNSNGYGFYVSTNSLATNVATLTIDSDNVTVDAEKYGVVLMKNGVFNLVNGHIVSHSNTAVSGNGTAPNVTANISGGSIESSRLAIYFPATASLNITGGTITGTTAIYQKCGTLTISGGTINATGEAAEYSYNDSGANPTGDAIVIDNCGYPSGAPSANISGATITSAHGKQIGYYIYGNNEEGTVRAGSQYTLNTNTEKEWVADTSVTGYSYRIATPTYVAKIGETKYTSLADAIAAVPTDGTATTITMIADSTEDGFIEIAATKNIVLDLNGHTVSSTASGNSWRLIANKGTLTIKDSSNPSTGKITANGTVSGGELATIYNLGGTLNVQSGKIEYTGNYYIAYAVSNSSNAWGVNDDKETVFNMTGGVLSAPSGDASLRVYQNCSQAADPYSHNTVTISGGTLDNGIFVDTYIYNPNVNTTGAGISTNITITGGTINGLIDLKLRHPFNTSLNITGGDFTNAKLWVRKYSEWNAVTPEPTNPIVTISGGTWSFVTGKAFGLSYDCGATSWTSYEQPYYVTGGVFNVDLNNYSGIKFESGKTGVANSGANKATYPYTVGVAVAQIGTKGYGTLADAIDAAQSGETVELLADITTSDIVFIGKSITLDGKGHSLITSASRGIRVNSGDVTVTIKNLTIPANSNLERAIQVDSDEDNVTLTIDHVTATATYYTINICGNVDDLILNITDSTLTGWGVVNLWGANGTVTITDSTLTGINDKGYNAEGWNDFGVLVIEGDTTGQTTTHAYAYDVTVVDTTIVSKSNNGNHQYTILYNDPSVANSITLEGCSITLGEKDCSFFLDQGESSVTKVKNTYLTGTTTRPELPEGYLYAPCGEDYYLITKAVAKIGDNEYATLQAAIDAAQSGDTITLLDDITITGTTVEDRLIVNKTITLDMNEKTIGFGVADCGDNFAVLWVLDGATLTITGEGTINGIDGEAYGINVGYTQKSDREESTGHLVIESGTFKGDTSAIQIQCGTVTINGGYFEAKPYENSYRYTLNCIDTYYAANKAVYKVKGGSYFEFDPANSDSENPKGNFVDKGYKSVSDTVNEHIVYTVSEQYEEQSTADTTQTVSTTTDEETGTTTTTTTTTSFATDTTNTSATPVYVIKIETEVTTTPEQGDETTETQTDYQPVQTSVNTANETEGAEETGSTVSEGNEDAAAAAAVAVKNAFDNATAATFTAALTAEANEEKTPEKVLQTTAAANAIAKAAATVNSNETANIAKAKIELQTTLKSYTLKDGVTAGTVKATKVVYDIKPVAVILNEGGQQLGDPVELNNDDIKEGESFTFTIPVPASLTAQYVKVKHISDKGTDTTIEIYEPVGEIGQVRYIEITVTHFSEFELEESDIATIQGGATISGSISLQEAVEINFYVRELATGTNVNDYSVVYYTVKDGVKSASTTVNGANWIETSEAGKYRFIVATFAAKEMTDTVTFKLLYQGNEIKSIDNYSIQKYCESQIEKINSSEKLKTLCKAVLDYGTAAQKYFGYKTTDLASGTTYYTEVGSKVIDSEYNALTVTSATGISKFTTSLTLQSKTELNFFLAGTDIEFVSVEKVATPTADVTYIYTVNENGISIKIRGITATDLATVYSINFTIGGEARSIEYSPMTYAHKMSTSGKNSYTQDICKALCLYYEAATAYFAN